MKLESLTCRLATFAPVLAFTLLPALVTAQTIRGTVVATENAPVPGVVMLLVDPKGSVTARAITNDRGQFRLVAGAPGKYQIRTLRIGYRPALSPALELRSGEELEQTVVLASVPVSLDTVRVATRSVCRAITDSAETIAIAWDQARTALTATQLTSNIQTIRAKTVRYQRTLDPSAKRALQESSVIDSGVVLKLWRSLPADSLRRFGYVHKEADGWTTYYAPDEDVLLSSMFIEDHCFRFSGAPGQDALLGIAFEPTRDRSRIPDIRGTLWLDRTSSELRRLEFSYTNTGARGIEEAGGNLEFARLSDGTWTIRRWNIRMPVLEQRGVRSTGIPGEPPIPDLRLREWRMSGGELLALTRGHDTIWSKPAAIAALPAPAAAVPAPPVATAPPVAAALPVIPAKTPSTPSAAVSDSAINLVPMDIRSRRMLSEFEERRGTGNGHFLTRADLEKQGTRALPDILSQIPGIRIARSAGAAWVTSGRGVITSINDRRQVSPRFDLDPQRACYADVWMNGVLMYGGRNDETRFDVSMLSPAMIEGIEYYASSTLLPPKYNRAGAACGALLIWTRE